MEKELNYLSHKIDELEGQMYTLTSNKKNYTTDLEINFYVSKLYDICEEKKVLENITNYVTINELK